MLESQDEMSLWRAERKRAWQKQYIQTLEQRLKNVEVALQVSPAVNKDLSQVSADPGHSHETSNSHGTTTADRTQSMPSRWSEEITRNIFQAQKNKSNLERTVFAPLPPKQHILHFISSALEDMYEVQSLFSTDDVLKLVNDQYSAGSSNCHANPTRWATLNALIATGIHWKADNKAIEELFPISWAYFKNAFAIFPEIVMNSDGIDSCQAMIAMAFLMRGTADARAFTVLLSAAAHAIHCIGLNLEDLYGSSDLIDIERRRRSFWTIYVLRCNASLNFDLPAPSDEVIVELPSQGLAMDTSSSTHLLRHMSTLALIQSRISRCFCPGSSLSKSIDKMTQALAELDNDLESWRTGLPTEVQPTALAQVDNLGIIQLHFAYYASTWKIYTAIGKLYNVPLTLIRQSHDFFASRSILTATGLSMVGSPPAYIFSVLHDPADSEVSMNLTWIGKFVGFLKGFQDQEGCDLKGLIGFCSKLYDIASFAQHNPAEERDENENETAGLWRRYTDLCVCLQGSEDPMQLAQGLLTNMPIPCAKANKVFSGILTEPGEDGFTMLVPHILKPSSFNFFAAHQHQPYYHDQVTGWGMAYQPILYSLPEDCGGYPAGTTIAVGTSLPSNKRYAYIDMYASTDGAKTFKFLSHVAYGPGPETVTNGDKAIYEVFLLVYKGKLIIYYSN
ncbi:hypothetical protein RAB80_003918 [Fusarium oxysporum f. sp. vasinfectum]|nr:hypothetical protein RAB80_003918 [Fusarium oxysporum f. sp. vasinfectum]KAK2936752.1 hypothetical protein FoTM2_004699 [Fusarium oxysporum f. sp. vasinfectum]